MTKTYFHRNIPVEPLRNYIYNMHRPLPALGRLLLAWLIPSTRGRLICQPVVVRVCQVIEKKDPSWRARVTTHL